MEGTNTAYSIMALAELLLGVLLYQTVLILSEACPLPVSIPYMINITQHSSTAGQNNVAVTRTTVTIKSEYAVVSVVWKAKYDRGIYSLSPYDNGVDISSSYHQGFHTHRLKVSAYYGEVRHLVLTYDISCTYLVQDITFIPSARFENLTNAVRFGLITRAEPDVTVESGTEVNLNVTVEVHQEADLLQLQSTLISYRNGSSLSPLTRPGTNLPTQLSWLNSGNDTIVNLHGRVHFGEELDNMILRIYGLWLPNAIQDAVQVIKTHFDVVLRTKNETSAELQIMSCQYRDSALYTRFGDVIEIPQRADAADCLLVRVDANPYPQIAVAEMTSDWNMVENILTPTGYDAFTKFYKILSFSMPTSSTSRYFYVSVNSQGQTIDQKIKMATYKPVRTYGGITPPFIYISSPLLITLTCEVAGDNIMEYGVYIRRTWAPDTPENWRQFVRAQDIRTITATNAYLQFETTLLITPEQVRSISSRHEVVFCGVRGLYNFATFSLSLS